LVVREHRVVTYGPSQEIAAERKIDTISAPNPVPAVRGAAATASLLAHLLHDKYAKHLPLYRQVDAFAALGVHISRKTLCDWVLLSALELTPVAEQIAREVLAGPVLQLDDTPIRVKRPGPGGNKQKYRQSSLWVLTNPSQSGVVFRFTEGRSAEDVSSILGKVVHASQIEVVLGDGYGGNRAGAVAAGLDVDFAGCWAHLLRKFRDALIEAPAAMGMFLKDIANLYAIEARAQSECLSAEARLQLRRRESFPIVRSLMRLTSGWQKTYSLKGRVAEAMKYTRNQRRALLMFLRDGRVPIDNNVCERAIRPVAIGRKNWLFAGSVSGAKAAAVLYTLVESAKATGVDPRAYLEAVLSRANQTHPSRLHELTPWHLAIHLPAYERQGS
jgi:transposase